MEDFVDIGFWQFFLEFNDFGVFVVGQVGLGMFFDYFGGQVWVFFYDDYFYYFVGFVVWDIDRGYFQYVWYYCDYVFDFIWVYVEVGYQDYVFFVVDDVEEVVFVYFCYVVGMQLVVGIDCFGGFFWVLLVVFYYLWVFDVEFVDFVQWQDGVVVVFDVGIGGWDW